MTNEVEAGGIQEPGRVTRWPWIVVAIAGVVAAASTAYYWLNRPSWGYCIDGEDFGYCDDGVFSSNAIVGSAILAVALVGLVLTVVLARGPRRRQIVIVAVAVFAVLLVVAWVLQLVSLEQVPIPDDPQNGPD